MWVVFYVWFGECGNCVHNNTNSMESYLPRGSILQGFIISSYYNWLLVIVEGTIFNPQVFRANKICPVKKLIEISGSFVNRVI